MAGRCWVCNPFCGKCQPAPKKSATCPECGVCTIFDRSEVTAPGSLLCKKCGHDLTALVRPAVVVCSYSGLPCAYPCGKGTSSTHPFGYQVCLKNTPPDASWFEQHPNYQAPRQNASEPR